MIVEARRRAGQQRLNAEFEVGDALQLPGNGVGDLSWRPPFRASSISTSSAMSPPSQVMLVNPSVPARTVSEFIAYAKANPGKISMASAVPAPSFIAIFNLVRAYWLFRLSGWQAAYIARPWSQGNLCVCAAHDSR
jgi:hypothetical protein